MEANQIQKAVASAEPALSTASAATVLTSAAILSGAAPSTLCAGTTTSVGVMSSDSELPRVNSQPNLLASQPALVSSTSSSNLSEVVPSVTPTQTLQRSNSGMLRDAGILPKRNFCGRACKYITSISPRKLIVGTMTVVVAVAAVGIGVGEYCKTAQCPECVSQLTIPLANAAGFAFVACSSYARQGMEKASQLFGSVVGYLKSNTGATIQKIAPQNV